MNKEMVLIIDASSKLFFSLMSKHRAPGAIPFFSKYRLIDGNLTNATFSDITSVGVFPGGNYRSLYDHIGSGDRYNLKRRLDGIFILPPKVTSPVDEEFISFERLSEQMEFFRRSLQDYAIISPATLIWRINFNDLLNYHLESGADITQVINSEGERLYTFILKKEKLMEFISLYRSSSLRNIVELYDRSLNIKTATYIHNGFSKYIRTVKGYYNVSMYILKKRLQDHLEEEGFQFRTKDPINPPSYFGPRSEVKCSSIATGDMIYGSVENSILFRRVVIEEGAKVINSIIMNNATIKKGSIVENAIIDKECIIEEGLHLKGKPDEPLLTEKSQIIKSLYMPSVCILSAECSPFIKRGGLADMVGSLAISLAKLGAKVRVFLPLYKEIKDKYFQNFEKDSEIKLEIDSKEYHISTYKQILNDVEFVFLDLYMYFDRELIYGYEDDPERFAYYSYATLEYLKENNVVVDVFHLNDWHTALFTLFKKKYEEYVDSKTLFTIHNLNYQGETSRDIIDKFNFDYIVQGSKVNLLEVGINSADILTTVSKTYAEELKYEYYSGNLHDSIMRRQRDIYGIVNGLDEKFNPETDIEIKANYNIKTVYKNKPINKEFLLNLCGFSNNGDEFVIGMVSRLDQIKGFDLILDSIDSIMEDERVRIVLLGVGDPEIMRRFSEVEAKYPSRIKCFLDYYGTKAEYIYAGADIFLMPSRIEPCGTSQMIALKYGTIPVVRQTGGLNDTIRNFEFMNKKGNGFKFYNYDSRDLIYTVNLAKDTYFNDKKGWKALIKQAMESKNSFENCAKEYLALYKLVKEKERS